MAIHLLKRGLKLNASIFILATIALIFVAGDEISWGQRIFHLTTPQELTKINYQNEITIHNIIFLNTYVGLSYIIIGFYGATAWLTQYLFPKLKKIPIAYYIPPWFCSVYFFIGFAYNYYVSTQFNSFIGIWSESAELMLYSGVAFTILSVLILESKQKLKKHLNVPHSVSKI